MAEEKKMMKIPHNVILEDRRVLTVSGVTDIDSFDEQTVILFTDLGELTMQNRTTGQAAEEFFPDCFDSR